MLSGIFITMFALLLLGGVLLLLAGMAKFASYASTKGRIVKWLTCSPCHEIGQAMEAADGAVPLAAVISYKVNAETFQLTTKVSKELLRAKRSRVNHVQVYYNPYEPGNARLKEGSPILGLSLIILSASAIILLLVL